METELPPQQFRVLILGGTGFVGRNLLEHLLSTNVCSHIKVADKCLPSLAAMHPSHEALYSNPIVEFVQADLNKPAHQTRVFGEPMPGRRAFDFVFNLAAETRYGQDPAVYTQRCTDLSRQCAILTQSVGAIRFIEVSTALLYKSQTKRPVDEGGKIDPFTAQSVAKLAGEREVLSRITSGPSEGSFEFDAIIVRLPFVYGKGDCNGLMPRIVCAAAYVELQEKMKFLWDASMRINTVHVQDVARGLWHLAVADKTVVSPGSIWNLCDRNDTDQGKVNEILGALFGIRTGFHGPLISNVARLRLDDVVETANETHLKPWETLCRKHGVEYTPLSPYMSRELLDHHHVYVDGTAVERTGFVYLHPRMTEDLVRESVVAAIEAGVFPNVLAGSADRK